MLREDTDTHGNPLHGREVLRLTDLPKVHEFDDLAHEYSIRAVPEAASGLIVYGRFDHGWVANPWTARPIIRELLIRLGIEL